MENKKYSMPSFEIVDVKEDEVIATSSYDPDGLFDKDPNGNWYNDGNN